MLYFVCAIAVALMAALCFGIQDHFKRKQRREEHAEAERQKQQGIEVQRRYEELRRSRVKEIPLGHPDHPRELAKRGLTPTARYPSRPEPQELPRKSVRPYDDDEPLMPFPVSYSPPVSEPAPAPSFSSGGGGDFGGGGASASWDSSPSSSDTSSSSSDTSSSSSDTSSSSGSDW